VAKKKRLLWQLYPTYIIIILVSLLAATWFASRTLKQFYREQSASDLEARALLFKSQILESLSPLDAQVIDRLCKKAGGQATTRITVILPSGKVVGDSERDPATMDNHVDRPEVIQALSGQTGMSTRYSRTLEKEMMYVGIPLKIDYQMLGVVRTSVPLISVDKAMKSIQIKIAIGGLFIAVLAAILSLVVSRRISRPIEEIKKGAECFAQGDFECRLPVSGSEELGSLSETMNQMAIELQERINGMKAQRNELEAVLSSMVEGVIALNKEERVISINQAAADMFETNTSTAQGRSIQEVVRNSDLQNFVKNALSRAEPEERDIVLYSDGERIINGHSTVLHDAGGNRIGALIVLNDVTRLRRLENIRRDFVANVSHEIKTPITAIKGFVETLRDGAIRNSKDAERFLAIIQKHVDRLDAIIEDLLSLSRIEEDVETEEIVLEEKRIKDVLLTAIQVCQVKAGPKNIRVELSCSEDLKAKIDPPLLEQAVVNLLDNAIKYSDAESEVQVEAKKIDREILINVRDKGCGIDKKHLSRLFERFYRVDKARSRKMGGTGLGLAIVKHITQAHRGHVTVESTPDRGSTFSLHLPRNLN
jgi:two-component system phosphate regulon sensor histidine kinase PhoR